MNERIKTLREASLQAVNRISSERALLVTQFYHSGQTEEKAAQNGLQAAEIPPAIERARCLDYILRHKKIYIGEGELIVGERGPEPKATPTYPEICIHSLEDLDILDTREKVSFRVDQATRSDYEEHIIPFWKGKSNRDKIMAAMKPKWHEAYIAGIFTEFQEQRAPGHTVLGDKIYQKGMLDIIGDVEEALGKLDETGGEDWEKRRNELKAMKIAAEAIIMFAERHADQLDRLAVEEKDPLRRKELEKLAEICRKVPAGKPESFHEALQYYWFVHLGVITELNPWDSFNPGRLDQHLLPFYKKGLESGALTEEGCVELLQAFWIKFNNHPAPPKVGVTARESNTYTDFCLINLGGLDESGQDAVNELSYIILDVIKEMRLLQPGSMVQISKENPDSFLHKAIEIIRTGFGQPSCFNTDAMIEEMLRQGKAIEDARRGGASGCVETGAFGTECYILTGYFNLTKILEITLHNGVDPLTGKRIGPDTGLATNFKDFDALMDAYRIQLEYFISIKIEGNHIIDSLFANEMPVPFLSLLIDDCVSGARDYNAGGARYNTSYIQGVGLGSLTDSLAALKYHVFDGAGGKKLEGAGMQEMLDILSVDFTGHEAFRYRMLYQTPKYGNDDPYADELLDRIFEIFFRAVDGKPTLRGGNYRINLLPTTSHVYFGQLTGAMPDGRKSGQPLSEGISPVQGADRLGPTAVLKSAAKIDHIRTGGTLLNQKFTPSFFKSRQGMEKISHLIRSYFKMKGHHIQFNVVDAATLRAAQAEPEKYRDLIVRVAGYSDYFNDLGTDLQNEIIKRTEHA